MAGREPQDDRTHEAPFEQLLLRLSRVQGQAPFGDIPLVEDAAASTIRTLLRRLRDGEWTLTKTEDIKGILISYAIRKVFRYRRGSPRRLRHDPEDPEGSVGDQLIEDEGENQDGPLFEAWRREYAALRRKMRPFLESRNKIHQCVFDKLIENEYGGAAHTREAIARSCGCSKSTVDRVKVTFETIWVPLVKTARKELDELLARLGRA
jgi:hypothetical protein